jgi:hypothetical protein
VHVQDVDFTAELCTNCLGNVYGVPKSTLYKWRSDARDGQHAGSGGRAIRDRVEGWKTVAVNMFVTFFISSFGTPQKALQNCEEMHPDSAYADTPEMMLMDRYSGPVLLEEYMMWRDLQCQEAPIVSETHISILWNKRLASENPFPILVRV